MVIVLMTVTGTSFAENEKKAITLPPPDGIEAGALMRMRPWPAETVSAVAVNPPCTMSVSVAEGP